MNGSPGPQPEPPLTGAAPTTAAPTDRESGPVTPVGQGAGRAAPGGVGIKDVARVAGLSLTTVSHALSGKGKVSAPTRERVRAVAEELGYRPAASARAGVPGRVRLLGLAAGGRDPAPRGGGASLAYREAFVAGAAAEAARRGHALAVVPARPGPGGWPGLPLDGLIVVGPVMGDPLITEARRRGLAVVTDGRPPAPEHSAVPFAQCDPEQGVALALDHLRERGAGRVALLSGPELDAHTLGTEHAYARWCARRAVPTLVERADEDEPPLAAARRLLGSDARPDGVHTLHETFADALLTAAAERGLPVPGELLVTTAAAAEAEQPGGGGRADLTVLTRSPRAMGALCVSLLDAMVHGGRPGPRSLPCALLPGASTARV
ncbi:LacI family DNA-binding transcriptional regulator [Streptomyces sp. NPDC000594]|uniref:LacI family DNA-binding transcriptional regulator n=1 Tax=Streptomyces sp. NPDC000594 TaxID=3154261 RepID=UPI003323DD19